MFGCVEKLGMSTKLPKEILDTIRYEEDLLEKLRQINSFEYARTLLVIQNNYSTTEDSNQAIPTIVQLPIPEVDQGPLDPNHVLCCVVEIQKEKCLYKLGNKHGLIDTLFPANGFGVCKQILIKIEDVNLSKTLSVREMARLCSNGTGQGYIKCSCKGACDKNCKCKKSNQVCNSRCHGKKANAKCTNH